MSDTHISGCAPYLSFLRIIKQKQPIKTANIKDTATKEAKQVEIRNSTVSAQFKRDSAEIDAPPSYTANSFREYEPLPLSIVKTIASSVDDVASKLKEVSLKIHGM